jgi:hypothetical protein
MPTGEHHSEYLARTIAALTPEGHRRVDELLEQLAGVVGGRERLVHFARAREAEADRGVAGAGGVPDPAGTLTIEEIRALTVGFRTIRDEEPLDDVADWANAVLALLDDAATAPRTAD